jgi:hypothetical protein
MHIRALGKEDLIYEPGILFPLGVPWSNDLSWSWKRRTKNKKKMRTKKAGSEARDQE